MPTFSYKALDSEGSFVVGEIEAPDRRDVARRLERLGYVALDTGAAQQPEATQRFLSFQRSVGQREITVYLRELSLVLRAGLTLDDALLLLAGEERRGLAVVSRDLRAAISGGQSFADALKRHPKLFGADLIAMVRVAEASGNLDKILESVGEERLRTERLLDKISSSLRYPAVLLVVALVGIGFLPGGSGAAIRRRAAGFRPGTDRPCRCRSRRFGFLRKQRRRAGRHAAGDPDRGFRSSSAGRRRVNSPSGT